MPKHKNSAAQRSQPSRVLAVPSTAEYAYGVIYARLSDTRNPNEISIERQVDNGHEYLRRNSVPHNCKTDHYVEGKGHHSGWSDKQRPEYRRMRLELPKRKGKGLVWCQDQSRFTRAEDATTVIRHWIEDIGVDLVFDADLVSLKTFDLWLQVHTRTFIHSIESQLGKARMSRYYKKFYDTGAEHRRRPLFGLKIVGTGKDRRNIANPETMPTVLAFLKVYTTGVVGTGTHGVRHMRASGFKFQNWRFEWIPATTEHLTQIVRNLEAYQPFIKPASLYARALKVRESRKGHHGNHGPMRNSSLLLRGLVRCAACGALLYQQRNHITSYHSYRHPHTADSCRYDGVHRVSYPIDAQASARLREVERLTTAEQARITKLLTAVPRDLEGERRRNARAALISARERLVDDWLAAGLTAEELKARRQKIDAELEQYPETSPTPKAVFDKAEIEQMFAELPALLVEAAENDEVGHTLARTFFKECVLDFETRVLTLKMMWEK